MTEWALGQGNTLASGSKERNYSALLAWSKGKVKTSPFLQAPRAE